MAEFYGMEIPDLPDGYVALDLLLLVKVLDDQGCVRYVESRSSTLHAVEALGMATTAADTLRDQVMRGSRWREEE